MKHYEGILLLFSNLDGLIGENFVQLKKNFLKVAIFPLNTGTEGHL